jgi:hypothetical protein
MNTKVEQVAGNVEPQAFVDDVSVKTLETLLTPQYFQR